MQTHWALCFLSSPLLLTLCPRQRLKDISVWVLAIGFPSCLKEFVCVCVCVYDSTRMSVPAVDSLLSFCLVPPMFFILSRQEYIKLLILFSQISCCCLHQLLFSLSFYPVACKVLILCPQILSTSLLSLALFFFSLSFTVFFVIVVKRIELECSKIKLLPVLYIASPLLSLFAWSVHIDIVIVCITISNSSSLYECGALLSSSVFIQSFSLHISLESRQLISMRKARIYV